MTDAPLRTPETTPKPDFDTDVTVEVSGSIGTTQPGPTQIRPGLGAAASSSKLTNSSDSDNRRHGTLIQVDFKADGTERHTGRYAIVDASVLTPSHNPDGTPNRRHRISEGQPRDRSDEDPMQMLQLVVELGEELGDARADGEGGAGWVSRVIS